MHKSFLAFVFLAFCPLLIAQQSLDNDAIIKLTKAELSDDLIVSTINAQPGTYDTSPDGLIALKTAGVSDKVVATIVAKAAGTTPTPAVQAAPTSNAATAAPESQIQASAPTSGVQEPAQQPAATAPGTSKPRVYLQSASKGSNRNAERDQSMEMSKDFEKDCLGVRVTINQNMADYTILLNHIEHGLIVRDNQIQIANKDGDLISKTKEGGSIKGDVKKACDIILAAWVNK